MLNWHQVNEEYVVMMQLGKAVIRVDETGGSKVYKPRIEDNQGNVVARFEPGFDDFKTADAFVSANLIELDRTDIDETAFHEKLVSTLGICINLFSQPDHTFHRWRLENIQRWLLHQPSNRNMTDAKFTDWHSYTFSWQQDGNLFQCDTPPHGRAILTKDSSAGKTTSYTIEIEDPTGVILILKDYYVPSIGFQSAEERLREILSELEQPFVDEVYLDQITFTLEICQRLLPRDTDPMQFVRLNYLENYLGEVLP